MLPRHNERASTAHPRVEVLEGRERAGMGEAEVCDATANLHRCDRLDVGDGDG